MFLTGRDGWRQPICAGLQCTELQAGSEVRSARMAENGRTTGVLGDQRAYAGLAVKAPSLTNFGAVDRRSGASPAGCEHMGPAHAERKGLQPLPRGTFE